MAVVTVMNGMLRIELACRCGWTHVWTVPTEGEECLELDGWALNLEKFSHRRSGSGGTGIIVASL